MGRPLDDPVVTFESEAAWEAWLADNHATADGVWIKVAKKSSGIPTVTHAEALEVALCYGWIDGQRKRFDEEWFLQRFTPRRRRSNWSKVNRGKVERLISEGRMRPSGLREVDRARADGRWDAAYDPSSATTVPEDSNGSSTSTRPGNVLRGAGQPDPPDHPPFYRSAVRELHDILTAAEAVLGRTGDAVALCRRHGQGTVR